MCVCVCVVCMCVEAGEANDRARKRVKRMAEMIASAGEGIEF